MARRTYRNNDAIYPSPQPGVVGYYKSMAIIRVRENENDKRAGLA